MKKTSLNATDAAETLAISALGFLTRDADRLGRFLAESGLGPADLRGMAGEPGFLVAVLDHLLADEPELLIFCEEHGFTPPAVWNARRVLGGHPTERG